MNCVVVDDYVCVKPDSPTVKLSPFEDDIDMDFEDVCDYDTPDLDITTICEIVVLHSSHNFSEESITSDVIQTIVNSITLQAATISGEQALVKFTRCKLKNMDTWNDWVAGEQKQLNQFCDL